MDCPYLFPYERIDIGVSYFVKYNKKYFYSIFRKTGIKKLVLCNNIMETLPETVLQLRNLAELDLSNNVLSFIPESIGTELPNLTHLVLRNNLISDSEFPKNVTGLARSLRYLNISGNRFTIVPPQILQLTGTIHISLFICVKVNLIVQSRVSHGFGQAYLNLNLVVVV